MMFIKPVCQQKDFNFVAGLTNGLLGRTMIGCDRGGGAV